MFGYVQGQLAADNLEELPSPPHIMDNDITPTGDSRQNTTAHSANIRT